LRIVSALKKDRSKLELYFRIIRLQLYEFLEQRIGLHNLSLVDINDAHLTQRRLLFGGKEKDLAIVHLSFVPLPCGKSSLGARQKLIFGGFVFGATGSRDGRQAKRENQPHVSRTYGCGLGRHGCPGTQKCGADHGYATRNERALFEGRR